MRLSRDVLIKGILQHQNSFFRLLDYIDQHDGSLEFPEALYLDLYNRRICARDEEQSARHLSIASLLDNGVFIHNDRNTGMISIERLIVDLLRFLDTKRAKELTQTDFELLRRQTNDYVRAVEASEDDSQAFQDAMSAMNRLLSEIHSKVKESVHNLTIQVENIAHDYKLFENSEVGDNAFKLYDRVNTLYTRYVMPCYEFIDAKLELAGGDNFSTSVQRLIDYLGAPQRQAYDKASSLQFRRTAITSYYKDIHALARKLEQFSRRLERDRNYFLAIESAFSELMDDVDSLRHGKQRNKYLTPNTPCFSQYSSFNGLKERKSGFSARFNWRGVTTSLRFKEYLTVLQENNPAEALVRKPLSQKPCTSDLSRQIEVARLMHAIPLPAEIPDLHVHVAHYLTSRLDDYSLTDLILGLESLFPKFSFEELRSTGHAARLVDKHYYFDYLRLTRHKEIAHV